MKNLVSVFMSVALLAVFFVGPVFSSPPTMDDNEPAISQDEVKDGESILDLITPDEAEAAPLEKDAGDPYEENFHKRDDLPSHESETEDRKIQEEEDEKEKTIM
ncbi:MAG: hypothetical protein H8E32_08755 [Nitrospinae bacterium]|nr:hypothetical protein [Nitrospinota bacterium]